VVPSLGLLHRPTTAAVCLAALLGALSGCSSPDAGSASAAHPTGRRLVVGLYDSKGANGPLHLDLANASEPELVEVYSQRRSNATLKLLPDEYMQAMVDHLDTLAFADLSSAGDPPPDSAAVRGWVCVDEGGTRRTFVVPAEGATAKQLQAFVDMKLAISQLYNHVAGLQHVSNPQGAAIFRDKQQ